MAHKAPSVTNRRWSAAVIFHASSCASQFQQLLVQQRLRDVVVKMLIQHVLPERRTEMRGDVLRQGSGLDRAVRQLVTAAAVPRIVRLDLQILDGEILIAEELRAVRQTVEPQRHVLKDQVPCLGAFGGPGPLSVGRVGLLLLTGRRGRAAGVVQRAGFWPAFWRFRQSLQPPHFLLELLNHTEQRLHQRSLLLRRNLNAANRSCAGLPYHVQRKASNPVFVKTGFHRVIEK